MIDEKEILGIISFIKETVNNEFKAKERNISAEKVFYNGNCGNMYDLLHTAFPNDATPCAIYINDYPYHIITKIGGKTYDISGEINLDGYKEYLKQHNENLNTENMKFEIKDLKVNDFLVRKMCDKFGKDEAGAYDNDGNIAIDIIDKIKKTIGSRKNEPIKAPEDMNDDLQSR